MKNISECNLYIYDRFPIILDAGEVGTALAKTLFMFLAREKHQVRCLRWYLSLRQSLAGGTSPSLSDAEPYPDSNSESESRSASDSESSLSTTVGALHRSRVVTTWHEHGPRHANTWNMIRTCCMCGKTGRKQQNGHGQLPHLIRRASCETQDLGETQRHEITSQNCACERLFARGSPA